MAARKPVAPRRELSVLEAALAGTPRELLLALKTRIAEAISDPKCSTRDLASLSRRLLEIAKELDALDEAEDGGGFVETPATESLDPSLI